MVGVQGLPYPHPCPAKLTWKYKSMLTYISVSFFVVFVFFSKNFVSVTVKNRVRVRVISRVRVRVYGTG